MDIAAELAASPMFATLDVAALTELATKTQVIELRGGSVLLRNGEPSDALYLVATGRLRAVRPDGTPIGDIGRGEPIGEIGMLVGESRSASVIAIRDSIVLRVERDLLMALYLRYPAALLQTTRTVIRRMRVTPQDRRRARAAGQRTVAVIPALADLDVVPLAQQLTDRFGRIGESALMTPERVDAAIGVGSADTLFDDGANNPRVMTWLAEQERAHRYLVYASPPRTGAWARRCMRQVDRILLVVRSGDAPQRCPMVEELLRSGTQATVEIVMLRAAGEAAGDVMGWRDVVIAPSHAYVDPAQPTDLDRLARNLSGRGIGLVLGGGGARGFAHLGLLRALLELQIPVDAIGGSSMGAFFGALHASGYDADSMLEIARQTFVENNFLNDYLFPSVALVRGRRFVRRLHDIFGDRRIEDLLIPFFCVSSNLSRGQVETHEEGPLYLWTATSMAVPGIAPPVVWREDLLVDGALLNSLPTDLMQARERGPVIASDVSTGGEMRAPGMMGPDPEGLFNWKGPSKRPGLFNIMFRTATVGSERDAKARAAQADVYLRMPVGGVALFDWKRFDEVAERGYIHALEHLTPVREALLDGRL